MHVHKATGAYRCVLVGYAACNKLLRSGISEQGNTPMAEDQRLPEQVEHRACAEAVAQAPPGDGAGDPATGAARNPAEAGPAAGKARPAEGWTTSRTSGHLSPGGRTSNQQPHPGG